MTDNLNHPYKPAVNIANLAIFDLVKTGKNERLLFSQIISLVPVVIHYLEIGYKFLKGNEKKEIAVDFVQKLVSMNINDSAETKIAFDFLELHLGSLIDEIVNVANSDSFRRAKNRCFGKKNKK